MLLHLDLVSLPRCTFRIVLAISWLSPPFTAAAHPFMTLRPVTVAGKLNQDVEIAKSVVW